MTNKRIILTFVAYYLPGYKSGGPIRTISNMVNMLGDKLDFRIVASDRDSMDTKTYSNVEVNCWNTVGKAKVFYASPENQSMKSFIRIINNTPHDVLYLNGFFRPTFTIIPLLARRLGLIAKRPTVIAPRGDLSQASLMIKRWKKKPYLIISRKLGIYSDLIWQVSSKFEFDDVKRVIGSAAQSIVVAPNLPTFHKVEIVRDQKNARPLGAPLRLCYLSRISPEKNLRYALQVLATVKVPIVFNIYGPVTDKSYWLLCWKSIKRLPKHIMVSYHGEIEHAQVIQTLSEHDLLFLPTTGENYGHVIIEALSAGLPVLISDKTPWRNLEKINWVGTCL